MTVEPAVLWSVTAGMLVLLAAGFWFHVRQQRRSLLLRRLGVPEPAAATATPPAIQKKAAPGWIESLGRLVIFRWATDRYRKPMQRLGYRTEWAASVYVLVKLAILAGVVCLYQILLRPIALPRAEGPVLPLLIAIAFWFFVDMGLDRLVYRRKLKIRAEMPLWLDLHAALVEGGLGFDAGLARIISETEGSKEPLYQELRALYNELMVTQNRFRTYREFAERLDIEELDHMMPAIAQAERLGAGMLMVLKNQADMVRNSVWEFQRERAEKLPAKLLFPTIFAIFPSMFVVVAVPGALKILDELQKMGGVR